MTGEDDGKVNRACAKKYAGGRGKLGAAMRHGKSADRIG
jgi:hypothetical protein